MLFHIVSPKPRFLVTTLLPAVTLAAVSLGSPAYAEIFTNETFDNGDVIGTTPSDPSQQGVTGGVLTAAGNATIGPDNVAELTDFSATDTQYLEYTAGTSGQSNLYLSFDVFNPNPSPTAGASGTDQMTFSVGPWSDAGGTQLNSNSKRSFLIDIYYQGTRNNLKVRNDVGTLNTVDYDTTELQSFQIYVNDDDSDAITYLRPDDSTVQTLSANSFAVWVNQTLVSTTASGDLMSTSGTGDTTGNAVVGRFGFITTSTTQANFLIDNVYSSDIVPEPASFGLLGFGATLLLRRRPAA